jgi:UTP--glucose-1-phosphate uridylyltransferase
MMNVYRETGRPVIALMEVPPSETHRYGIIAGDKVRDRLFRLERHGREAEVEGSLQPTPSSAATSSPRRSSEILENTGRGAGGEIQLTDGLLQLIESGDVYGYVFEGRRYDAGEKLGYLKATLDYALKHSELGEAFREYLLERMKSVRTHVLVVGYLLSSINTECLCTLI